MKILMDKIMYYYYREHFYENVVKKIGTEHELDITWLKLEEGCYVQNVYHLLPLLFVYPGDFNKMIENDRMILGVMRKGKRKYPMENNSYFNNL